ncbi:MAG: hypothetical protein ACRETL_01255, partial [Gammaproteobacteria bacterium]
AVRTAGSSRLTRCPPNPVQLSIAGIAIGAFANSLAKGVGDNPDRAFNYGTLLISTALFAVIGGLIGSGIHR